MRVAMAFLAAAVMFGGCFFEARGGVDGARHRDPSGHIGAAVGIGGAGKQQAGAAMLGVESSPLGSGNAGAPALAMGTLGGRYEHSFTESHPGVRWYGRVMLGGNICSSSEEMNPSTDSECSSPRVRRSAGVFSAGVGVAFTSTKPKEGNLMIDSMAGISVGLVYTVATDDAQDDASFLGLELSFFGGGDLFTPVFSNLGHD